MSGLTSALPAETSAKDGVYPRLKTFSGEQLLLTEDYQAYGEWLTDQLGQGERLTHSYGVFETAIALAQGYHLPQSEVLKAGIAGLLHDSAKLYTPAKLFACADDYGLVLDDYDRASPQTLHPFIGAELVQKELGINDSDILNAIRFHTTGRAAMSILEKIVYVADKVEARTRNPLYIQEMTAALDFDNPASLDIMLLTILDATLKQLLAKKLVIHPRTLETRNDILKQLNHSN